MSNITVFVWLVSLDFYRYRERDRDEEKLFFFFQLVADEEVQRDFKEERRILFQIFFTGTAGGFQFGRVFFFQVFFAGTAGGFQIGRVFSSRIRPSAFLVRFVGNAAEGF